MHIALTPIGILHTPLRQPAGTPIQSARSTVRGQAHIDPAFADGLDGIEGFSHIILIYLLDRVPPPVSWKVQPFLDDRLHGVFATRHPARPNPIGLSVVRLLQRSGVMLEFEGADMLDGTPLLDIKPYVPEFDQHPATRVGWYEKRALP